MILRRMADAIRTQNWFTVIIEILIVVIGIFLGLQVDDWNQTRKANADNRLFIQQLGEDIDSVLLSINEATAQHQRLIDSGKIALRYLNGEDIFGAHRVEIEFAFERMHQLPRPKLLNGHLNSILSGDVSQRVTNRTIQRELETLASEIGSQINIYNHIEDRITEITAVNRRMIGFGSPGDDEILISYDPEALKQSADFRNAVQNAVVFHGYARRLLEIYGQSLRQYFENRSGLSNSD